MDAVDKFPAILLSHQRPAERAVEEQQQKHRFLLIISAAYLGNKKSVIARSQSSRCIFVFIGRRSMSLFCVVVAERCYLPTSTGSVPGNTLGLSIETIIRSPPKQQPMWIALYVHTL